MGIQHFSNLARAMFFNITFFDPFASRTRSSLGKLNAVVWIPDLVSPAANTSLTTLIGDDKPRLKFLYSSGIGRLPSISFSQAETLSSFWLSSWSTVQRNAS